MCIMSVYCPTTVFVLMLYPGWSQFLLTAVTPNNKRITACLKIHRKGRKITFNSTQHGCNCISIDKAQHGTYMPQSLHDSSDFKYSVFCSDSVL